MNAQDPLAQLADIHTPENVGWWPLAWGWWVLIALVVLGLGLLLWRWRVRRRRLRYRREALAVLDRVWHRYREQPPGPEATRQYLQSVSELLRRTTLSALPARQHHQVASLSGTRWLAFLDATAPVADGFTRGPGRILAEGPYQPNPQPDADALHRLVTDWLKHHHLRATDLKALLSEVRHA